LYKYFPILEPRNIAVQQIVFNPDPTKTERINASVKEWHFFDKTRENKLVITTDYMYIESTKYKNWDEMRDSFIEILETLFKINNQMEIKRFGLRYINNITMPGNKFSWGTYLNKNLLSIFKINLDKDTIARAVGNIELNFGNYFLRFQYGMVNPDHPAPIKKKYLPWTMTPIPLGL